MKKKYIAAKVPRNSNFELLRLLSMFVIVAYHYSLYGRFTFENTITFNRVFVQILSIGGRLGINCFVLISGYFLCSQENLNWKSIIRYYFQVTTYSLGILFIIFLSGYYNLTSKDFLTALFPLFLELWWFAKVYFTFIILIPFLSYAIARMDQKTHLRLITILTLLGSIIPTFTTLHFEISTLLWFFYLCIFISYIRKYPNKYTDSLKLSVIIFICSLLFLILSIIVIDFLNIKFPGLKLDPTYFTNYMDRFPLLLCSLSLFTIFKNKKPYSSKVINSLAACSFGIYLIHDHPLLRYPIWIEVFKTSSYQNSTYLIIHTLLTVSIVFIACLFASYIYNATVMKVFNIILDKIFASHQKR